MARTPPLTASCSETIPCHEFVGDPTRDTSDSRHRSVRVRTPGRARPLGEPVRIDLLRKRVSDRIYRSTSGRPRRRRSTSTEPAGRLTRAEPRGRPSTTGSRSSESGGSSGSAVSSTRSTSVGTTTCSTGTDGPSERETSTTRRSATTVWSTGRSSGTASCRSCADRWTRIGVSSSTARPARGAPGTSSWDGSWPTVATGSSPRSGPSRVWDGTPWRHPGRRRVTSSISSNANTTGMDGSSASDSAIRSRPVVRPHVPIGRGNSGRFARTGRFSQSPRSPSERSFRPGFPGQESRTGRVLSRRRSAAPRPARRPPSRPPRPPRAPSSP